MVYVNTLLSLVAASASFVAAAPAVELATRASCTFTGASGAAQAIKQKASCATIILNNVVVPAGTTLDLTKLKTGTKVSIVSPFSDKSGSFSNSTIY
jgi:polygalacturonase